jgi:hypothetical protein
MEHDLTTNVSITAPTADELLAQLDYKHGFFVKAFADPALDITDMSDAVNLSDLVVPPLPFDPVAEAADITMLSGKIKKGDSRITAAEQTVKLLIYLGMATFTLLQSHSRTNRQGLRSGIPLAFARVYPDGNAYIGKTIVQNMTAEGDSTADAFGYNTTFSWEEFEMLDARQPVVP